MENKQAVHPTMSQAKKDSVLEKLWLNYFNETLYTKGVITEDERNRMKVKIETRARKHDLER